MENKNDEIRGFARYVPTALAKTLLIAAITLPCVAFKVVRDNPQWFFPSGSFYLEQTLSALTVALAIFAVVLIILLAEYAYIVYEYRHKTFITVSNRHPLMSFRWLAMNAAFKHYLALAGFGGLTFVVGVFVCQTI